MSARPHWLARLADVRPGEGRAVAWAFVQFVLLMAALYAVRPLRDEMGIRSGVENMQWLFSGTFLGIVLVVPAYAWAVSRWSRRIVVPRVFTALALSMLACWLASRWLPGAAQPALSAIVFIWISVFNVLAVSVFWSLLVDLVEPEASRRLFGIVAAGGTVGAVLGPSLAGLLVTVVSPEALLLVAGGMLAAASVCTRRIDHALSGPRPDPAPVGGGMLHGFRLMLSNARLRGISGYLLCMTWISTILYFEQAHIVKASGLASAERTALFAWVDLAVNATAITVQTLLTGRIIRRAGLVTVLVLLPVISVAALGVLAVAPTLAVIVVVQVARRATNYALARPAREMLYTDVERDAKYKGKNVVDTVVYRGGDAVAGWAFRGLQLAGLSLSAIAWLGVPVALGWAVLGRRLGRDASTSASAAASASAPAPVAGPGPGPGTDPPPA